jgi:hypothetical protein
MKRKIERYVKSKNIGGVEKLYDDHGRFLIGQDIEGTLRAVRMTGGPGGSKKVRREKIKSAAKQLDISRRLAGH